MKISEIAAIPQHRRLRVELVKHRRHRKPKQVAANLEPTADMKKKAQRPFRTAESHAEEAKTRAMVSGFLQGCGYRVESSLSEKNGQTIVAHSPSGTPLRIRVRICWRPHGKKATATATDTSRQYSAAQLLPRVENGEWVETLTNMVKRQQAWGITHYLFVQRIGEAFHQAGLVPATELVPIWVKQRDKSDELIQAGKLGNVKKNHAQNGTSPTIWLLDDPYGTEVADQFWSHPGVINLLALYDNADQNLLPEEVPLAEKPSFEGALRQITVNAYERDRKARDICIQEYGANCQICGLDFSKAYGPAVTGLIHVHHLKPISKIKREYQVDPKTDLLPVCPNCHAVIHFGGTCRTVDEVKEMLAKSPMGA